MLAYTSDTEYLVLMKDPYLSMPHYAGYPLVYNIQYISSAQYKQLANSALVPVPGKNYQILKVDSRYTTLLQVYPAKAYYMWQLGHGSSTTYNLDICYQQDRLYVLETEQSGGDWKINFGRYGADLHGISLASTSINYRYQILLSGAQFGSEPHGRNDVFHESSPNDKDIWFFCTAEKYTGSAPTVAKALFYRVEVTNESYTSSIMHEYGHFAMCGSTHAVSSSQAVFAIAETKESGNVPFNGEPYVKLITLAFDTGAYSVVKQSAAFPTASYYRNSDSEYGLIFFKHVSSGVLENIFIATVGGGLDESSQALAYDIGIVTTTEDRSTAFGTASNAVSISGASAAASGTLGSGGRNGAISPGSGGESHLLVNINTGSKVISVSRTGLIVETDYDSYVTLGSVLANQLDSQTDCSAERSLLLNYPPYTTENEPISIDPGKSIMINVLGIDLVAAEAVSTDDYDITIVDGFDDYDGDLPLFVVIDSWSYGGAYPGTDLQYSDGWFWSQTYDTGESGMQYQIYFTLEDQKGCQTEITLQFIVEPLEDDDDEEEEDEEEQSEEGEEEEENENGNSCDDDDEYCIEDNEDSSEADSGNGQDSNGQGNSGGGESSDGGGSSEGGGGGGSSYGGSGGGGGSGRGQSGSKGGGGQGDQRGEGGSGGRGDGNGGQGAGGPSSFSSGFSAGFSGPSASFSGNDCIVQSSKKKNQQKDKEAKLEKLKAEIEISVQGMISIKFNRDLTVIYPKEEDTPESDAPEQSCDVGAQQSGQASLGGQNSGGRVQQQGGASSQGGQNSNQGRSSRGDSSGGGSQGGSSGGGRSSGGAGRGLSRSSSEQQEITQENLKDLIKIKFQKASNSLEDEDLPQEEEVNFTWAIDDLKTSTINVQVVWNDHTLVSSGIRRDIMLVEVDLTLLDKRAKNPEILFTSIPKQMSLNETAVVETIEVAGQATTVGTAVCATTQLIFAGAMSQIWGLINGLQLYVHMDLLSINMPANAQFLSNQMALIATFDIVDNEMLFSWLLEFPDEEELNFKGSFENVGYDAQNMVVLMGIGFCIFFINGIIMLWIYLSKPCLKWFKGKLSFIARKRAEWEKSLYWNFWIRYFLEDCLATGICICCYYFSCNIDRKSEIKLDPGIFWNSTQSNGPDRSTNKTQNFTANEAKSQSNETQPALLTNITVGMMNLTETLLIDTQSSQNETEPQKLIEEEESSGFSIPGIGVYEGNLNQEASFRVVNDIFSYILLAVLIMLPFFIGIKLFFNYDNWENEKFEGKYGSLYEDMKKEKKMTMFYNTYFMFRRGLFTAVVCFAIFQDQAWLQIHLTILATLVQLVYMHLNWPFEENMMTKLEIFNEYTTILLLYLTFGFASGWLNSPGFRNSLGFVFIAVVIGNMGTHLYFLIQSSYASIKEKCIEWKAKRNSKKQKKSKSQVEQLKGQQKVLQMNKRYKAKIISPQYEEEDKCESIDDMAIPTPVRPDSHLVSTQMTNKSPTLASYQIKSKLKQVTRKLDQAQIETADPPLKSSRENENGLSTPNSSQRNLVDDPVGVIKDQPHADILNSIQSVRWRQASLLMPNDYEERQMPDMQDLEGLEDLDNEQFTSIANRKQTQKYGNILKSYE